MTFSIKRQLIFLLVLLTVVPLIVVGVIISGLVYDFQEKQVYNVQNERVRSLASEFSTIINHFEHELSFMVKMGSLSSFSREEMQLQIKNIMIPERYFQEIILIDSFGKEIIKEHLFSVYTEFDLLDRDDDEVYLVPKETGEVYFSNVGFSELTGEPFIRISVPIIDPVDLEFKGVLLGTARLKSVWSILAKFPLSPGENLFILDSDDKIIGNIDPSVVLSKTSLLMDSSGKRLGLSGENVISAEKEMLLGTRKFVIVAQQARHEALLIAREMTGILFIVIVVFFLISLVVGMLILRPIFKPIKNLVEVSEDIFRGNLTRKAEIYRYDELGTLSSAFNRMTGYLTETMENLREEIIERSKVEKDLRRIRNLLKDAVDSMDSVILALNQDGVITLCNNRVESDLGIPCSSILDKRIFENIPQLQKYMDRIINVINNGRIFKEERVQLNYKNNDLKIADITVYPLSTGNQTGAVIRIDDVTEKTLLEERYQQAQKAESLGRLAGGITHDLNNLLVPIIGYSEILQDSLKSDTTARSYLDNIHKAGYKAKDLLGQLLSFTRNQPLVYVPLNLGEVLEELLELIRRTVREDISLDVSISSGLPTVVGDPDQLKQAIMNLTVNAQEAMPSGGKIEINVSSVLLREEKVTDLFNIPRGDYVALSIADTGKGIDKQISSFIFEPFFSTKGEGGTGMGLSTVFGVVKQHEGHLWFETEQGKGSVFYIYLPVTRNITAAVKKTPDNGSGSKERREVLLVEDNEQVRLLTETILKKSGFRVFPCSDAQEAIDLLTGQKIIPSILLTDIIMPGMNGLELFNKAREIIPGLKVLYMSGYTNNFLSDLELDQPERNFIQKPFSGSQLTETILDLLNEE